MAGFQDPLFIYDRTWHMLPLSGSLGACRLLWVIQDAISCLEMFLRFPLQAPLSILSVASWILVRLQKLVQSIIVFLGLIQIAWYWISMQSFIAYIGSTTLTQWMSKRLNFLSWVHKPKVVWNAWVNVRVHATSLLHGGHVTLERTFYFRAIFQGDTLL